MEVVSDNNSNGLAQCRFWPLTTSGREGGETLMSRISVGLSLLSVVEILAVAWYLFEAVKALSRDFPFLPLRQTSGL